MAASGRTLSITIPTVLAKRTGLCGVLPEVKYEYAGLDGELPNQLTW